MKCYVNIKEDQNGDVFWTCSRFGLCKMPISRSSCYYANCQGRQEITTKMLELLHAPAPQPLRATPPVVEKIESVPRPIAYQENTQSNKTSDDKPCLTKGCPNMIEGGHKMYCSRRCQKIHNKREARRRKRETTCTN